MERYSNARQIEEIFRAKLLNFGIRETVKSSRSDDRGVHSGRATRQTKQACPVPIRQFAATLCCQTLTRNYAPAVAANGLHGACHREDRFDTRRLAGGVERRIVRSRLDIASG
jgi:hypothetical protein